MQFFLFDFGLSLGLNISSLLFLDLLGLLNDFLLVLGLDEVGNDFPSIYSSWGEFGDSFRQHGHLLWGPLLHGMLHFGKSLLLGSLDRLLLLQSLLFIGVRLNNVQELINILWHRWLGPYSFYLSEKGIKISLLHVSLHELVNIKLIIVGAWHILNANSNELLHSGSVFLSGKFLGLLSGLGGGSSLLLLLGLCLSLLLLLHLCLLMLILLQILLRLLKGLLLFSFLFNDGLYSWVKFVASLRQFY